jgi:hypothetical protein
MPVYDRSVPTYLGETLWAYPLSLILPLA